VRVMFAVWCSSLWRNFCLPSETYDPPVCLWVCDDSLWHFCSEGFHPGEVREVTTHSRYWDTHRNTDIQSLRSEVTHWGWVMRAAATSRMQHLCAQMQTNICHNVCIHSKHLWMITSI